MKAILLDIEGTTTDKRFVTETLFPYARERIGSFVIANEDDAAVSRAINLVRGAMADPTAPVEAVARELELWIDADRKEEPLKMLQGMIWEEGYRDGTLRSHVYADVPEALARWKAAGLRLAIFSSGSIAAQKLLFAHTEAGDLTRSLDAYFDLTTGSKREAASYEAIAGALGLPPEEIRFYTDVPAELEAAREAGLEAVLVERDGPIDVPGTWRQIGNFTGERP
ncbi:MAG: acireductone synthase [Alphaproteobacteria bacterium]|nr:acireductone synthase [Alphaproteobacteria bacterium]